ncbi:40S ribosomal protein S12, partial [Aureobasidium sp. EXF-10728]
RAGAQTGTQHRKSEARNPPLSNNPHISTLRGSPDSVVISIQNGTHHRLRDAGGIVLPCATQPSSRGSNPCAATPAPLTLFSQSDVEEPTSPVAAAEEVEVGADESANSGSMSVLDALKGVLKISLIHDGLARGLREASKALDRRQAHMCVLNEACEEEAYKKLIVALCGEHKIPLIKVPDGKQLGEWAGLCQIDREGNARKVVNCSCVVVKDWGEESQERSILLNYFQTEQ